MLGLGFWAWAGLLVVAALVVFLLLPSRDYWLRIVTYYCCLMLSSAVSLPWMFPWRSDPRNTKHVAAALKRMCRWMKLTYEFRNFERLDFEGPAVIISNHQSALDILGVFERLPPGLVPIIKKELMLMGPFGMVAYCTGSVPVDRSNPKQSHNSVSEAAQRAKERNLKVLVYAEGTRHHAGQGMLPLKKGGFHLAVQAGIPIIPIVYSSYRHFYSKPLRRFRTGGHVIAQVLPPIPTTDMTSADVAGLTSSVEASMLPVLEAISAEADARFAADQAKKAQ